MAESDFNNLIKLENAILYADKTFLKEYCNTHPDIVSFSLSHNKIFLFEIININNYELITHTLNTLTHTSIEQSINLIDHRNRNIFDYLFDKNFIKNHPFHYEMATHFHDKIKNISPISQQISSETYHRLIKLKNYKGNLNLIIKNYFSFFQLSDIYSFKTLTNKQIFDLFSYSENKNEFFENYIKYKLFSIETLKKMYRLIIPYHDETEFYEFLLSNNINSDGLFGELLVNFWNFDRNKLINFIYNSDHEKLTKFDFLILLHSDLFDLSKVMKNGDTFFFNLQKCINKKQPNNFHILTDHQRRFTRSRRRSTETRKFNKINNREIFNQYTKKYKLARVSQENILFEILDKKKILCDVINNEKNEEFKKLLLDLKDKKTEKANTKPKLKKTIVPTPEEDEEDFSDTVSY